MEEGRKHGPEFRRCLIQLDVDGMLKLWRHVAPHLADQSARDALISMHIARCEMRHLAPRFKSYSEAWLAERGYRKVDGKWISGATPVDVVAGAVGIAVKSSDPRVARRIHRAMDDALRNALAKGVSEAPVQKEHMLKARARERFRLRLA